LDRVTVRPLDSPHVGTIRPGLIEGQFSRAELLIAWTVAAMRATNVICDGRRGLNGQQRFDWANEVKGAIGELAASEGFNLAWTGPHERGCPDVGGCIEARAVLDPAHRLILQLEEPDQKPDVPFVLVDLSTLPRWRIVGWIMGKDAKRDDWRDDPVGGRPAYWVPRQELRDPMELRELCQRGELPT
jgi:hypothetical protein